MSLGLGSVVALAVQTAPWLTSASKYKGSIFVAVGVLLILDYWLAIVRPRRMACAPGEICHVDSTTMRVNRMLLWISVVIYVGAVAATYGALLWLGRQS